MSGRFGIIPGYPLTGSSRTPRRTAWAHSRLALSHFHTLEPESPSHDLTHHPPKAKLPNEARPPERLRQHPSIPSPYFLSPWPNPAAGLIGHKKRGRIVGFPHSPLFRISDRRAPQGHLPPSPLPPSPTPSSPPSDREGKDGKGAKAQVKPPLAFPHLCHSLLLSKATILGGLRAAIGTTFWRIRAQRAEQWRPQLQGNKG